MTTNTTDAPSPEDSIRASVAQIAAGVTNQDLEQYGRQVTDDFLEMNKDLQGRMTSTVGRQARLDVLQGAFESSPWGIEAVMEAAEVAVDGDRGFALVDGTLLLTPRAESTDLGSYAVAVDIYLFYRRDDQRGWLCERSMAIERSRAAT